MNVEFGKFMRKLCAAYGKRLEDETATMYFSCLNDIPMEQLEKAAQKHICSSKWFPTISELRPERDKIGRYLKERDKRTLEWDSYKARLPYIEATQKRLEHSLTGDDDESDIDLGPDDCATGSSGYPSDHDEW